VVARTTVAAAAAVAVAVAGAAAECRSAGVAAAARTEGAPLAVCGMGKSRGERFSSLPAEIRSGLRSWLEVGVGVGVGLEGLLAPSSAERATVIVFFDFLPGGE
jgi:hypothetical protein